MIIFLDTETTGLHPGNICQLSYIMQDDKKVIAKNYFFTVDFVEQSAFMVHGFSVEKLKDLSNGQRFCDHIKEIDEDFSSAKLIVAHNFSFDQSFLRKEFENCGKLLPNVETFCSMKATTPICKLKRSNSKGYKYPKLTELCQFLGIGERQIDLACAKFFGSNVGYHDARFDTVALCLAVNKLMQLDLPLSINLKDYV